MKGYVNACTVYGIPIILGSYDTLSEQGTYAPVSTEGSGSLGI